MKASTTDKTEYRQYVCDELLRRFSRWFDQSNPRQSQFRYEEAAEFSQPKTKLRRAVYAEILELIGSGVGTNAACRLVYGDYERELNHSEHLLKGPSATLQQMYRRYRNEETVWSLFIAIDNGDIGKAVAAVLMMTPNTRKHLRFQ